jgi:hypothetical protein
MSARPEMPSMNAMSALLPDEIAPLIASSSPLAA